MKVALAVWNGRISPVFDVSRNLLVIEVKDCSIVERIEVHFSSDQAMHKVRRLMEMEVAVLLCGAVSRQLAATLEANGISLYAFISGDVESVIGEYLKGRLPSPGMSMPGCRSARRRKREKFRGKKVKI
ncbi:MAG: hypothetical protein K9J79_03155 [Desulfobacteraceae bacterium]|nr:hypothetical protein [Desulfobacteraceae bacterium]